MRLQRQGQRRVGVMTGLADLAGAWSLEEVTGALTDFADAAAQAALTAGLKAQIKRGKLPGMTEEDADSGAGMVVLAMGKMGARELNYSSDIDLICLFDETRFDASDFHDARTAFVRATRAMSGTLNDLTGEGYVAPQEGQYTRAIAETGADVFVLLFSTFGGFSPDVVALLRLAANARANRLTSTEYDETTWSARTWLSFSVQKLSVAVHRAAAGDISRALGLATATDPRGIAAAA